MGEGTVSARDGGIEGMRGIRLTRAIVPSEHEGVREFSDAVYSASSGKRASWVRRGEAPGGEEREGLQVWGQTQDGWRTRRRSRTPLPLGDRTVGVDSRRAAPRTRTSANDPLIRSLLLLPDRRRLPFPPPPPRPKPDPPARRSSLVSLRRSLL